MAKPGPNGQTPVSCDLCDKTLKDGSGLSGHKQFAHKIDPRSKGSGAHLIANTAQAAAMETPQVIESEQPQQVSQSVGSLARQLEQVKLQFKQLGEDLEVMTEGSDRRWSVVQDQIHRLSDLYLSVAVIADEVYVDLHDGHTSVDSPWRQSEITREKHEALIQALNEQDWNAQAGLLNGISNESPPHHGHLQSLVMELLQEIGAQQHVKQGPFVRLVDRKRLD